MKAIFALGIGALVSATAIVSPAVACALAVTDPATPLQLMAPSDRPITTTYGIRKHPILGVDRHHRGIDFDGPMGDPVKAAAAGQVVEATRSGEFGNRVEIDHGSGWRTSYSHLSRFALNLNSRDCVDVGTVIGYVGSTGLSATPHLHFEVTRNGGWLDPTSMLAR